MRSIRRARSFNSHSQTTVAVQPNSSSAESAARSRASQAVRMAGEEAVDAQRRTDTPMQFRHDEASAVPAAQPAAAQPATAQGGQPAPQGEEQPFVREGRKVGRNEPCPCGSGRKYKQCHGKLA